MIVLYSNGCPRCNVLKAKLDEKGVDYVLENDIDVMIDKGYFTAPVLVVDEVEYEFGKAVKWVNGLKGEGV